MNMKSTLLLSAAIYSNYILDNIRDISSYSSCPKKDRYGKSGKIRDSKIDPKINRNDPCPCGSGKKFKKCCLK